MTIQEAAKNRASSYYDERPKTDLNASGVLFRISSLISSSERGMPVVTKRRQVVDHSISESGPGVDQPQILGIFIDSLHFIADKLGNQSSSWQSS